MITSFDDREKAYEAEFAHQERLKFDARERAIRSLAVWAAERLGKTGQDVEAYASRIVALDVSNAKPDAAIGAVASDLRIVGAYEQEVRHAMDLFLAKADLSVDAGVPPRASRT